MLISRENSKSYEEICKSKLVYEFHFKKPVHTLIAGFNSKKELDEYINDCFKDHSEGKLINWNEHRQNENQ